MSSLYNFGPRIIMKKGNEKFSQLQKCDTTLFEVVYDICFDAIDGLYTSTWRGRLYIVCVHLRPQAIIHALLNFVKPQNTTHAKNKSTGFLSKPVDFCHGTGQHYRCHMISGIILHAIPQYRIFSVQGCHALSSPTLSEH